MFPHISRKSISCAYLSRRVGPKLFRRPFWNRSVIFHIFLRDAKKKNSRWTEWQWLLKCTIIVISRRTGPPEFIQFWWERSTGKFLSEALIFASSNPQYDDRMFIELQVQYIKFQAQTFVQKLFLTFRTIFVHNMFSPGLSLEFSCIELIIQWTICCHIVG